MKRTGPRLFNRTPTFLGVTYDRTLSFRPQVEAVKARVRSRIRIMASLSSKEWGWSRHSLRTIYMATVHSVLHFCGAAWQPWLAKTNLLILERVQNRALRCMTGQLQDTPLECLRNEAGIDSFATAVRRNCQIAWEKCARLPTSNPRSELYKHPVHHRWRNRNRFSCMAQAACSSTGLDSIPREPFKDWHPPPWTLDIHPLWTICSTLVGGTPKSSSPKALLADAINSIEKAGNFAISIYTDGSADRGNAFGGSAAVITEGPAINPTHIAISTKKGGRWTSSFEMELTALSLAVDFLATTGQGSPAIICTDSQAALIALKGNGKKDGLATANLRNKLNKLNSPTFLQWIPGTAAS